MTTETPTFLVRSGSSPKRAVVRKGKLYFGCEIWPVNRAYLALDKLCNRQQSHTMVLDGVVLLATRKGIQYNDMTLSWEDADSLITLLYPHYQHKFYEDSDQKLSEKYQKASFRGVNFLLRSEDVREEDLESD